MWKKKRMRTAGLTRTRITNMGRQTLFCASCGLEAPLDLEVQPCAACHGMVFVPLRMMSWDASLTEKDRAFLKTNRISIK